MRTFSTLFGSCVPGLSGSICADPSPKPLSSEKKNKGGGGGRLKEASLSQPPPHVRRQWQDIFGSKSCLCGIRNRFNVIDRSSGPLKKKWALFERSNPVNAWISGARCLLLLGVRESCDVGHGVHGTREPGLWGWGSSNEALVESRVVFVVSVPMSDTKHSRHGL